MSTVNRGGKKIQIVRKTSHHVPIVVLGHLDTKGMNDLLSFISLVQKNTFCREGIA